MKIPFKQIHFITASPCGLCNVRIPYIGQIELFNVLQAIIINIR